MSNVITKGTIVTFPQWCMFVMC